MTDFWPSGIELSDTQTPKDILQVAQKDWHASSDGIMELVLQDRTSTSGNPMIIVHAEHIPTSRTARLLTIVHRIDNFYPARIQPEDEELPDFLKKSYSIKSPVGVATDVVNKMVASEHKVSNQWVAETPSEFREKLTEAFNLGFVKSKILNLASANLNPLEETTDQESQEASPEN